MSKFGPEKLLSFRADPEVDGIPCINDKISNPLSL